MSGTSGDGIDASVIKSDGETKYEVLKDKFYKYPRNITSKILILKDKIQKQSDLDLLFEDIKLLDNEITNLHINVAKDMIKDYNIDILGFHGQTLLHVPEERFSKQIGSGNLLSAELKKTVVYNFRKNDLLNGGQGAPLSPIFHNLIVKKKNLELPVTILNIGGISNITTILKPEKIISYDIGPGNCLIDKWIRLNSKNSYDKDGLISRAGKVDKILFNQILDDFYNNKISTKKTFDVNDFWFCSSIKGLSLENGAATLTEITSKILSEKLKNKNIYVCGGGRKNKFLLERIEEKINIKIKFIDDLEIDGDFVESQAFGFLSIRSLLGLPITFPTTTGCAKPCSGGTIVNNY